MTNAEKLEAVKTILRIDDSGEDVLLTNYLDIAAREIIGWRFSNSSSAPATVPAEYEPTQIQAAVIAYTQSGIEGQTAATENGITRRFAHADVLSYIRSNVIPIAGTGGSNT